MKNGDLSNEVEPKALLVFEGALGAFDRERQRTFNWAIKRERWHDAADCWILNPLMMQRIWYVCMRMNVTLDVVTFAGPPEFGEALGYRLQDVEELPVHQVYATRPELLARKIGYQQDLAVIYDPDETRWTTWGSKGRILRNVNDLGNF